MTDERTEFLKLAFSVQEIAGKRRTLPEYPDLMRYSRQILGQYIMTNSFFVTYKSLNKQHWSEEISSLLTIQDALLLEAHLERVEKLYRLCGQSLKEIAGTISSVALKNTTGVATAIGKLEAR